MKFKRVKQIRSVGRLAGIDQPFQSRAHAGWLLSELVAELDQPDAYVLAVSPGGIPVAAAIGERRWIPIDTVAVAAMLPAWPGAPPYGAIAFDGSAELDAGRIAEYGIARDELAHAVRSEFRQAVERAERLRGDRPFADLGHRVAVIVDDGLTDPIALQVAIAAVKNAGAAWTVLALPTGRRHQVRKLSREVDRIYCAHLSSDCHRPLAGSYENLEALSDGSLRELLDSLTVAAPRGVDGSTASTA